MKTIFLCLLVVGLLMGAWVSAQDDSSNPKSKGDVRSITGCLSQGDSAKEFLLTASDGSTWELRNSSAVSLTPHVGHEVKVTGAVSNAKAHNMKEDAQDAAKDSGMKKSNAEHGHLRPTDVQMISDTCTK
jgi:hypothetical protein